MAACLRSHFLAMSWSSAPSSASTSLNAPEMARCSGAGGSGTEISNNFSGEVCFTFVPAAVSRTFAR